MPKMQIFKILTAIAFNYLFTTFLLDTSGGPREASHAKKAYLQLTPGPSKLEKVVDPGSGPRGPLPEIGVHYLVLFSWEILEGHHRCQAYYIRSPLVQII